MLYAYATCSQSREKTSGRDKMELTASREEGFEAEGPGDENDTEAG